MIKKKVIILATAGLTTNLLHEVLSKHYEVSQVFIEQKISKKIIIKNRIKKLGFLKVFGQLVFMISVPKILSRFSKKRINQILNANNLTGLPIPKRKIKHITSINNKDTIGLINTINPDLIFVNGTRIISKQIIKGIKSKLINIHVGITPKYRGVHGGFWALYNKQPHLFGTTLHYIDSGVDTGLVIGQKTCVVTKNDNFSTYPILQFCLGLELIENNLNSLHHAEPKVALVSESSLYYHPTVWEYLYCRMLKK